MKKRQFKTIDCDYVADKMEQALSQKHHVPHLCVTFEIVRHLNAPSSLRYFLTDLDHINQHVPDDMVGDALILLKNHFGNAVLLSVVQPESHFWSIPSLRPKCA